MHTTHYASLALALALPILALPAGEVPVLGAAERTATITNGGYVTTAYSMTSRVSDQYAVKIRSTVSSIRPVVTGFRPL